MNINILGISELKWTGMGEFNSDDHYYYCGQESLRRNGVTLIVNKSPKCSTWVQPQKQRISSICFHSKSFNIIVKVKVAQSYWTLCDPMDYTVHGILQARILEQVAFPFSRGSSQHRDRTQVSCITGITVTQVYVPTTDAKEAEVKCFYEDLQDLLELTPQKMSFSSQGIETQKQEIRRNLE